MVKSETLRPLHVVMICLLIATVSGGMLLLSAAKPLAPVDGAIAWQEESPLRAVVQLLCLNYDVATVYPGAIKSYILGMGAVLSILALAIAIAAGSIEAPTVNEDDEWDSTSDAASNGAGTSSANKNHIAPLIAAQVLAVMFLLWSFASSRWLWAPTLAVGASILLTIQFLWSFGLGNGLSPLAARVASRGVIVVSAITAGLAVWYHYGRNPTLRAEFPLGNPAFLAAALIPGILLCLANLCELGTKLRGKVSGRVVAGLIATLLAVGVSVWAFVLTDSRGPSVGLLFGVLGMVFFAVKSRGKLAMIVISGVVAVAGWTYLVRTSPEGVLQGRSTTLRLRFYAWDYAWRMFNEKPFTGHGQGAFVLKGDTFARDDVLDDPLPFTSRIAHAHNEWLETMADLGSVGIVLILSALIMTLRAGCATLAMPPPNRERWVLIALMGALVGLVVEECFGVGLRVPGMNVIFFTVLGLIWALSGHRISGLPQLLSKSRGGRVLGGVLGGVIGLFALVFTQQDFAAARNSHNANEALRQQDFAAAIHYSQLSLDRLNPQRVLTNLARLTDAFVRMAEFHQVRARDRHRRAYEGDIPDQSLISLAQEDYSISDSASQEGSRFLKELVSRSPGFINQGRFTYRLSLVHAASAAAQGDEEAERAWIEDAKASLLREMERQPYSTTLALDYVSVAGTSIEWSEGVALIARPLRHHRISDLPADFLQQLAANSEFEDKFAAIHAEAVSALETPPIDDETGQPIETWAVEKLRLEAAIRFLRGEYERAWSILDAVAPACDDLADSAPLAAASCFGELAICRFFSDPDATESALNSALRAIELAPDSQRGREITRSMKLQMTGFYLAAGHEERAVELLWETAPPGTTPEEAQWELGARYRRICESLLQRRGAGGMLRIPPADLVPKLRAWATRAIELNPGDPGVEYLAADLAFSDGDMVATAQHLERAIRLGLNIDAAREFLQTARDRAPEAEALQELWTRIAPTATANPPQQGSPPTSPPPEPRQEPTPTPGG